MPRNNHKPSIWEMMLQHVIVFLICIVFPGATTMMAPVTWMTWQRDSESVSFTAKTCVYFVVPFRVEQVENVTEITQRKKAGTTQNKRSSSGSAGGTVHVDGEGFLQVHGDDGKLVEVSVSPVSLEGVVAQSKAFLESPETKSARIVAIANWKFGGLMGGVLSLFTLLYVVGYSLGFLKFVYSLFKKLLPSPP